MNIKIFTAACSVALMVSAAPAIAATVNFDSFDFDQLVSDQPSGVSVNTSTVGPGILSIFGGSRTLTVENTAAAGNPADATTLEVFNSFLAFSNKTEARGRGELFYNGGGGVGALGDLTSGATTNAFFFDVRTFDNSANVDFTVNGVDGTGNMIQYTENLMSGFSPLLTFAEFADGDAFDFTNVSSIQFIVDSTDTVDSVDGSLNGIALVSTVPLPASALLLLGGLGGLTVMRRRRKS